MAMQNAKEELIVRALLNLAWQTQTGWRKTNFKGLKNKYIQFALILKGWRLRIYDLHSTEGHVKSIFATHSENGLIFDSCFNSDRKMSEQKLLYSILKNISLPKLEPFSDLPDVAKPLDHAKFYTDPKNLNALKFLDTNQTSDKIFTLKNPNLLETIILNKAGTFPAVAYCQHPTWPKISWGSSSIKGKNLWPHPLA